MTSRAIEPGSTAYGDRQTLESGLSEVLSGQEQAMGAPAPAPSSSMTIPEDPLGALMSGEVAGDPNKSPLAGLSFGQGGAPSNDVMLGDRAEKIRQLAQGAASPIVRNAARAELRRMANEGI